MTTFADGSSELVTTIVPSITMGILQMRAINIRGALERQRVPTTSIARIDDLLNRVPIINKSNEKRMNPVSARRKALYKG